MNYLKEFGIAFILFLVIDFLWLSLVAKNMYNSYLGTFLGPVKWIPAILFYLIFVAGLVFFVIHPAVEKGEVMSAIIGGLFFGLVTYATYDLTNLATLKDWPLQITLIDLVWGMVLGASVSAITTLILK